MNGSLFQQMQKAKREKRVELRAFARAFATEEGQKVLEVLERELGYREPSSIGIDGHGVDVNATMIRDGQKVAIKFIHDMRTAGARVVTDESGDNESEYTPKS